MAPDGYTRVYNPDMPVDVPHGKGCVGLHIMAASPWILSIQTLGLPFSEAQCIWGPTVPVGYLLLVSCSLTLSIQTLDFLLVRSKCLGDWLLVTSLLLLLVSLPAHGVCRTIYDGTIP